MSILQERPAPTEMRLGYSKRLMLVTGRANPELAARIADKLGVGLSPMTHRTFSNGEVYCRYEESVRGADVFIVQPTCENRAQGLSANDALMELMAMIDAAIGGSAHRVIAVTPWYGYSRQDKKSAPREPISARLVARMLETAGIDRILTMDLHSGQIQGFFQIPLDHLYAGPLLSSYFAEKGMTNHDTVIVSPDVGGVVRALAVASRLNADLAIGHDAVVAVSCMALDPPDGATPDLLAGLLPGIREHVADLRASGSGVEVVEPGDEFGELSGWGHYLMDVGRTAAAFEAGLHEGDAALERIKGVWSRG